MRLEVLRSWKPKETVGEEGWGPFYGSCIALVSYKVLDCRKRDPSLFALSFWRNANLLYEKDL